MYSPASEQIDVGVNFPAWVFFNCKVPVRNMVTHEHQNGAHPVRSNYLHSIEKYILTLNRIGYCKGPSAEETETHRFEVAGLEVGLWCSDRWSLIESLREDFPYFLLWSDVVSNRKLVAKLVFCIDTLFHGRLSMIQEYIFKCDNDERKNHK